MTRESITHYNYTVDNQRTAFILRCQQPDYHYVKAHTLCSTYAHQTNWTFKQSYEQHDMMAIFKLTTFWLFQDYLMSTTFRPGWLACIHVLT